LDKIAAGDSVTNTTLGQFMNNELNTLGGMDKENAKTEWNKIIMEAIGNYDPDAGNKNSGEGAEDEGGAFTGNTLAESQRNTALKNAKKIATSSSYTNREEAEKDESFIEKLDNYTAAGGKEEDFWKELDETFTTNTTLKNKGR
jgi:hypothetical protein